MLKSPPNLPKREELLHTKWYSCLVDMFSSLPGRSGLAFLFIFIFLFFSTASNYAQVQDTTLKPKKSIIVPPLPTLQNGKTTEDSLEQAKIKPKAKPAYHSPKTSALMSTIIPGLGQVYNKKYWKVPVIYAGLGGLAYSINQNQKKYSRYIEAYKFRIDGDSLTIDNFPRYSDENLNTLQQYYKRFRNLSVIGFTLIYVMNIVDASVDAHMFTFDVSDDLSFHIQPTLLNIANAKNYTTGLSLNITF
ncbi:MAG: DUF5683 domain-containing protein [Bacteroidota bacterium]